MTTHSYIVDKYTTIVFEYFTVMATSECIRTMDDHASQMNIMHIGLSAITHIYKLALTSTKNVFTAAGHCQKGMYLYIDYIEQSSKINSMRNIDYADAVSFIYEKMLSSLFPGGGGGGGGSSAREDSSSVYENIVSMSQSHHISAEEMIQCRPLIDNLLYLSCTLVWFSHPTFTITDRMEIIDAYLAAFLNIADVPDVDNLFIFIGMIQAKTEEHMNKQMYLELISTFLRATQRAIKRGTIPSKKQIMQVCAELNTSPLLVNIESLNTTEVQKKRAEHIVRLVLSA